jgi:CBS domain-containing protein
MAAMVAGDRAVIADMASSIPAAVGDRGPSSEENTVLTIKDLRTRDVVSVRPETPLKAVAQVLVERGVSGLPVIAEDGTLLGVVSEADLIIKAQDPDAIHHRTLARLLGDSPDAKARTRKSRALTAAEAMTAPAVTIGPHRPIHEAAAIMSLRNVNRLPVVDDGRVVGIVTRADLVRAYVRTDEDLVRTIREDVILRVLWLDPSTFAVDVRDGVATVVGHVARRSTAEMVGRAVRLVPGIVDVTATVTWAEDDSHVQPSTVDAFFPFSPR